MKLKIHDIPLDERPRERCLRYGADCLSLRELIAIVLGSGPRGKGCYGLADDLIGRVGTNEILAKPEKIEEIFFKHLKDEGELPLSDLKGLGEASKARLLAVFEFARRYHSLAKTRTKGVRGLKSNGSKIRAIAESKVTSRLKASHREWLGLIPIYRPDRLGEFCIVEWGVRSHINFEARRLFSKLFALKADAFILIHNHPSGDCRASNEDHELTLKLQALARQLHTPLMDHCIVTRNEAFWFGG